MEDLLTFSEAIELLGNMAPSTFKTYVDNNAIRKVVPPGKKHGKYIREDVEKVANERRPFRTAKRASTRKIVTQPFIDWIGVDDVLTSLQLDYRLYGPDVFLEDMSYYADRVKRNPQVALAVYDSPKREKILAYISLLPLPEALIVDILKGARHETTVKAEEVETYEREGEYMLLAESVAVDPEHREQLNTLLKHLVHFWCEQYPKRYITKIYAQAESESGDILIQKLFFAPREDLATNAYMLNLKRPGASKFVRSFQQCIKQKGTP